MPLILKKSIDEFSRAELETWLEPVRARRMAAAFEYMDGQAGKLKYEDHKIQRRFAAQIEMLGKELSALDRGIAKVEERLNKIYALQQEHGLIQDMITSVTHTSDMTGEDE